MKQNKRTNFCRAGVTIGISCKDTRCGVLCLCVLYKPAAETSGKSKPAATPKTFAFNGAKMFRNIFQEYSQQQHKVLTNKGELTNHFWPKSLLCK